MGSKRKATEAGEEGAASQQAPPPPGDTLNKSWAKDTGAFGYRMLKKMGWKDGSGLGKNQHGRSTHVKVTKREDGLGLGAQASALGGQSGWNSSSSAFASILSSLNEVHGNGKKGKKEKKKAKKREKKKKKEGGEEAESQRGEESGGDEKERKKNKKKNKEDQASGESKDEGSNTASPKAKAKVNANAGARKRKPTVTDSLGGKALCPSRSKRVRAKDVRGLSSADLRAILGHSHSPPL